jgi:hypothetical protein
MTQTGEPGKNIIAERMLKTSKELFTIDSRLYFSALFMVNFGECLAKKSSKKSWNLMEQKMGLCYA